MSELITKDVYQEDELRQTMTEIAKGFADGEIEKSEFEKAKRNLARLAQRRIVDRNGHSRIVWVKVGSR